MPLIRRFSAWSTVLACLLGLALPAAAVAAPPEPLAFPGAQGWAAHTSGGRGGQILRVTTLDATPSAPNRAIAECGD